MIGDTKRVLILAYYFPPMGMSGVQRTAKFAKYLPDHGWEPHILTVEPGGYFAFDPALLEELRIRGIPISRTASWDPTRVFGKGKQVALPDENRRRTLSTISQWLFLPDNKIGWWPHAIRKGHELLSGKSYSAVMSTAPPYSSHLIARRLSRKHGLPLVTDYRDDWLGNPRHVYPSPVHRAIHARAERAVGRSSAATITINEEIAGSLRARAHASTTVIPQGFDPEDYASSTAGTSSPRKVRLVYAGVFYDRQTPGPFLEALSRLLTRRPVLRGSVEAHFVGLFPAEWQTRLSEMGLVDSVHVHAYRTHQEAMHMVSGADVAWLTVGSGEGQHQISTGKLYAYVGANVPILGLVPDGAASRALKEYGASWVAHPDRPDQVYSGLEASIDASLSGTLPVPNTGFVSKHNRQHLAGDLAAVLNRVSA